MNLTLSVTANDLSTPFKTLAMSFQDGFAKQFLIPRAALIDGQYYEFRLGFPFPTTTYYTNTRIVKTYDVNSPFVSDVQWISTNSSITLSWLAPEYADGLVGYNVTLSYNVVGNGGVTNVSWVSSQLTQVSSVTLPLTQVSVTFGCSSGSGVGCLFAFTRYQVGIAVIRDTGTDVEKVFYATTQQTVVSVVKRNTASLFLYGGRITVSLINAVPMYGGVSVSSTILSPLRIQSQLGDVSVSFASSTVQTISIVTLRITMTLTEYNILSGQILASSGLTPLTLFYGLGQSIPITYYCLLDNNALSRGLFDF